MPYDCRPSVRSQAASPDLALLAAAARALWNADTVERVFAAGRELLEAWAPGAQLRREPGPPAGAPAEAAHGLNIPLSGSRYLVLDSDDEASAAAARLLADAIAARLDALGRFAALQQSVEHLARAERLQGALYAIADQASAADTDLAPMFQALHRIVGTLMYAENFFIAQYDAARDILRFPYYADTEDRGVPLAAREVPAADVANGPTWYVIRNGKPLMGSLASIARQVDGPFQLRGARCEDWLGVPLLHGQQTVGCVVVQSYDRVHGYSEQDKTLLTYVAQHIQTALERRLAHAELERRVAERTAELNQANQVLQKEVLEHQRSERMQAALLRIAELANATSSLDDFYPAVHRVVGDLLYARNFYIALLSPTGDELTFPYLADERDHDAQPRKLTNGITEYVMRHGTALLADHATVARLQASGEVSQYGPGAVCWLGVPLRAGDRTVGALAVQSYSPGHTYGAHDQELLTFVSYHIANALERVRAAVALRQAKADLEHRVEERTRELAQANGELRVEIKEREQIEQRLKYETLHDALTGLPNRALLLQRLDAALQRFRADPAQGFAVLFLDLDRFKVINDSAGHLVGDELLTQAGRRICGSVKPADLVARLGGDEFGVLLEGIASVAQARGVAQRIIESFNAPFCVDDRELFTATSVGIALAAADYAQPEDILRDADAAMYSAKADGRHRCAVFDDGLRREALQLSAIENDLRRAVGRHEFVPYYQPIVALDDGRVIGYEALMRWHHPQRGLLLPGDFLGVADDIGATEGMDWELFEQVCADLPELPGGRFVAINLSARHFRDPELDRRLLGMLARHGVPPGSLHIEVTEHAMLENPAAVQRTLETLRGAGIGIALDDFGTGYSSLSYLHQYPVQTIKIDRSFITGLTQDAGRGSEAIIRTIIAMSHLLSMQAIAEGVETERQRDQLLRLGCRYAQGFLYGRAQPFAATRAGAAPPARP